MDTGERRIPPAVPLFAALIFAVGVALWQGGSEGSSAVQASPAPVVDDLQEPVRVNSRSERLTQRVKSIIRGALGEASTLGAKRETAQVSVLVKELGVEGDLVEIGADRSMKPASNMKLATTAAALALLGGDACFETTAWSEAAPVQGELKGDLVVRAGGDPLFLSELGGAVQPILDPFVADLKRAGVERVQGDLVLDLGTFGDPQPAPGWPSPSQHWKDYCALSSGFTANAGCISICIKPGGVSQAASVEVLPRGHGATLEVEVETIKAGGALDPRVVVRPDLIKVWGEIPEDVREYRARLSHPDPVGLFASVFRHALYAGGIKIEGGTRLDREAPGAVHLAGWRTPILSTLGPINTHSNNSVADQLFLKIGLDISGDGDREAAAEATAAFMTSLGVAHGGYLQVDGSGLSKNNRISARQLVALLDESVKSFDEGASALVGSLARAGMTGTLEDRMVGTGAFSKVRAKTGFINGASALSGVVMTEDERFYVFSILVEYEPQSGLNTAVWKPMQDAICEAIVDGP